MASPVYLPTSTEQNKSNRINRVKYKRRSDSMERSVGYKKKSLCCKVWIEVEISTTFVSTSEMSLMWFDFTLGKERVRENNSETTW